MSGLFVIIYQWFSEYFFAGMDALPAVVQGLAPELCTLCSLACTVAIVAVPAVLVCALFRWVLTLGNMSRM